MLSILIFIINSSLAEPIIIARNLILFKILNPMINVKKNQHFVTF